jgi:hypothetical protein
MLTRAYNSGAGVSECKNRAEQEFHPVLCEAQAAADARKQALTAKSFLSLVDFSGVGG